MKTPPRDLNRLTQIGDLANSVRQALRRFLLPITVLLGVETAVLGFSHSPGTIAFGLISLGSLVVFGIWMQNGIGLPIVPVLSLQHLVAYGMPIVIGHEVIRDYPPEFLFRAGLEVLIFSCAIIGAWRLGMQLLQPSSALSYALQGFNRHGSEKLRRIGFTLISVATGYTLLQCTNLLNPVFALLPSGTGSLIVALMAAVAACGFFIVAMFEGTRALALPARTFFWVLLVANCVLTAAGYLLSPATTVVISVLIGLFWGSGRLPWRYLTVVMLVLSFFNAGKYTMRDRYWYRSESDPTPQVMLAQMPASYVEWIEASFQTLAGKNERVGSLTDKKATDKGLSLFERINNLQNLLFVINATETWHIEPLGGKTYTLIPPLLLPRILWPDKPRTHEGQVMLNVHFGRQDLNSTYQTYVAWGLLPEAYGNFGANTGSLLLGLSLGFFFAWLENFTARKLLLSLEGLISFTILLGMANSYEMVASVLVTTLFQGVLVLILASAPFVERIAPPPSPPAA